MVERVVERSEDSSSLIEDCEEEGVSSSYIMFESPPSSLSKSSYSVPVIVSSVISTSAMVLIDRKVEWCCRGRNGSSGEDDVLRGESDCCCTVRVKGDMAAVVDEAVRTTGDTIPDRATRAWWQGIDEAVRIVLC